ncbi:MAG: polyphosphate polymerase domain-containing protein [Chloroflexi bacterium]|nr:polyphosphate polymerase domain-containing protein [Chloroflexota bacterium]
MSAAALWEDARYERKLRIPEREQADIEPRLRLHRAAFAEIHHQRQVCNVYFDTPGLRCFHDNMAGAAERFKVRIRWYGAAEGPAPSATLEIKRKRGHAGIKDLYPLGQLEPWTALDPASLDDRYAAAGVPAGLRLGLAALQPVLFNRYRRRYYASVDGRFRATIDDRMTFRQILAPDAALRGREADVPGAVLELKYRLADETRLPDLVGDLPYRVTRSSKYVNGIRATWR